MESYLFHNVKVSLGINANMKGGLDKECEEKEEA